QVDRISFVVPLLLVGVAIFDTGLVSATRLLNHRPLLQGARDHTSHRLVFIGVPVPAAVALIYAAGASLGWLAVIASRIDRTSAYLLCALVGAIGLFVGVLMGMTPVYETSRRRRLMLREVDRHEEPGGRSGISLEPREAATAG
ncbi:MAG TPA: hypothetical protein VGR90_05710, partial [Acidimicrobiales bacterium]|nr:hypothetical protein [Acidimicrobiales bacterium]